MKPRAVSFLLCASLAAMLQPASAEDAGAPNVVRLTVRSPRGGFNRMVVSLTLCEPGTDRCATIDDVMVDTGSTGLRLEASAVPGWMRLPPFLGSVGRPLAECLRFVHDTAWGPLVRADVRLGGLMAVGLPLQVIADDDGPQPAACPRSDVRPTANGTLGLGQHLFDCQGDCDQSDTAPGVFVAAGRLWTPHGGRVDRAERLPNPVSFFDGHANGIVVDLPAPPDGAAAEVTGTLTFGVGTAVNNQPGAARVLALDAGGRFTTTFAGKPYPDSYIDSGTETFVLDDDRLPRCPDRTWANCARPRRRLPAELLGRDGTSVPITFSIGDYGVVQASHAGAADGVAVGMEPGSRAFVWGAPFFFGRRVALVMEGSAVPGRPELAGPSYLIEPASLGAGR